MVGFGQLVFGQARTVLDLDLRLGRDDGLLVGAGESDLAVGDDPIKLLRRCARSLPLPLEQGYCGAESLGDIAVRFAERARHREWALSLERVASPLLKAQRHVAPRLVR